MQPLISASTIAHRVRELGASIRADYAASPDPVLVGVLRGSLPFLADLMRAIDRPLRVDLLTIRSYQGTGAAPPELLSGLSEPLAGSDVLVVEDIVDRGETIAAVTGVLAASGARSVAVCSLLVRRERALPPGIEPRYAGFEIGPDFVVGYGLDYNQRYRNLPYIAVLGEEMDLDGAGPG